MESLVRQGHWPCRIGAVIDFSFIQDWLNGSAGPAMVGRQAQGPPTTNFIPDLRTRRQLHKSGLCRPVPEH